MADHQSHRVLPSDLDVRDPQFSQKAAFSNLQNRCEMMETIAATKQTLAASKELMAEADRILAQR